MVATATKPSSNRSETAANTSTADKAADRPAAKLPRNASFIQLAKHAFSEWSEDKATKLSAALAYYAMISLAPLLVITLKVLGIFFGAKAASGQLKDQIAAMAGPQVAQGMQDAIAHAGQPGTGIFAAVAAIVVALVGAGGVFGELQDSLNIIWEVQPRPNQGIRGFIRNRFLSMSMVLGVAFLLLVSMFVSTLLTGLSSSLMGAIFGADGTAAKAVGFTLDLVISTAVITLLFAAIFKLLPDVRIGWRDVWLGGFLTAVLFQIGKYGLSLYFGLAAPGSAYGAAGSLVVLLLWVYYSGLLLFYGAEFTQVYARRGGRKIEPKSYAVQMTDEDRMERGVPHREDIEQAASREEWRDERREARRSGRFSGPAFSSLAVSSRLPSSVRKFDDSVRSDTSHKRWLFGAAGLALGAIAGGVGRYLAEQGVLRGSTPSSRLRKPNHRDLTTIILEHRLDRIEQAAGDVESFEHKVRAKRLADEVEALSHRIRNAELRLRIPAPATFGGRMVELFREAKRHWSQ